ncbi:MAG: FAD-dependent oxidoreductase [Cyanobacteriota bacterium]|nr:FAD-dependent oxidoreductase [Cyanobacteriota bacterium]
MSALRSAAEATDRIVIVGGGFGGLYTALNLAERRHHPPVLLIEPNERFLFLPLLYELLSGELRPWEVAPTYPTLLAGRGVALLQDRVVRIDAPGRCLHTAAGRRLEYGRLVIATGARSETFGVEGVDQHTLGFRNLADVDRLQQLVHELRSSGRRGQRLAVVGAGATGVELACKLADLLGSNAAVALIEQGDTVLPLAKAFNREQAQLALERRQVAVRLRSRVAAVGVDQLRLRLDDGLEDLTVNGTIWTAGLRMQPPQLEPAANSDRLGRLLCHPDLRVQHCPAIFAIGDGAHVPADPDGDPNTPLPSTAQVAFQQAPLLAANLLRSLAGEPLEPFRFRDLGEMLSLGCGDACLSGGGLTLAGPLAFQLRRLAYLTRLPGRAHQLRVAAGWLAERSP